MRKILLAIIISVSIVSFAQTPLNDHVWVLELKELRLHQKEQIMKKMNNRNFDYKEFFKTTYLRPECIVVAIGMLLLTFVEEIRDNTWIYSLVYSVSFWLIFAILCFPFLYFAYRRWKKKQPVWRQKKFEQLYQSEVYRRMEQLVENNPTKTTVLQSGEPLINEDDTREMKQIVNQCFAGFEEGLRKKYPELNDRQVDYCYLSMMGFSMKEIAILTGENYKTVWYRIKSITKEVGVNTNMQQKLSAVCGEEEK